MNSVNNFVNIYEILKILHKELVKNKKCLAVDSPFIYFVKTARNGIGERFRIRRQFRSRKMNRPVKNYFFVLGTDSNGEAIGNQKWLQDEIDTYKDIIIGDFIDTYNNLPLKTKSIYQFARWHCSKMLQYFFFHDSDTLVNTNIEKLVFETKTLEDIDYNDADACDAIIWFKIFNIT